MPSRGWDVSRRLRAEHRQLYGYVHENRPLEIVAARVEAIGRSRQRIAESASQPTRRRRAATRRRNAYFDGSRRIHGRCIDRANFGPAIASSGPAIVYEANSTTVIDPGWQADVLTGGELLLTDVAATGERTFADMPPNEVLSAIRSSTIEADPVMLEIFNNQFAGIAEQMGITLRNTASSVNVKERLDFSCAIFTATGDLVVNAPHIPVHLGAMGETVRRIIADNPTCGPATSS